MTQILLFVCGDVMTGRGIDQIPGHPNAPGIQERYVSDAREVLTRQREAALWNG